MKKQYQVTWLAYPRQDLPQLSSVLSGLAELDRRGEIDLQVVMTDRFSTGCQPVMELEVREPASDRLRRVAIDFYDDERRLAESALAWCDVYFKRQFGAQSLSAAPTAQATKLRPLGLTIASFSRSSWRPAMRAIFFAIGKAPERGPNAISLLQQVYYALREIKQWIALPDLRSVTAKPTDARGPGIVFQPRLWDMKSSPGDVFDVANVDRIGTVQVLRRQFPDFARSIGLVSTSFASRVAPKEVLSPAVKTRAYHRQLRQSLIAVNCVGLSGSVGWKFAEYLAAGNAIVSQPIRHSFLSPVLEGVNYLPYTSHSECIQQCERISGDPDLAQRMAAANTAYFREWVDPPSHARKILDSCFCCAMALKCSLVTVADGIDNQLLNLVLFA